MTRLFLVTRNNEHIVIAKNHAKTNEICSAVSMMMYSLVGYLKNYGEDFITHNLEPGDAMAHFTGDKEIYNFMKIGFLQLQETYPEEVNVEIDEK